MKSIGSETEQPDALGNSQSEKLLFAGAYFDVPRGTKRWISGKRGQMIMFKQEYCEQTHSVSPEIFISKAMFLTELDKTRK